MFYPKRDKAALKEITNFYRKIFDFERNRKMFLLWLSWASLRQFLPHCTYRPLTALTSPSLHLPAPHCTYQPLTALTGPSLHLPAPHCTYQPLTALTAPHCTYQPLTAVVSTFTISAAISHSPSVLTAGHTCGRARRVSCHDDTRLDPSFATDSA